MRPAFSLICALLALPCAAFAEAAGENHAPSATQVGIEVYNNTGHEDVYRSKPGTHLHYALSAGKGQTILAVKDRGISKATDSLGNDLLSTAKASDEYVHFSDYLSKRRINPAPKVVSTFLLPVPPSVGANSIAIEGQVTLVLAESSETITSNMAPLAPGSILTLGDLNLKILSVEIDEEDKIDGMELPDTPTDTFTIEIDQESQMRLTSMVMVAPDGSEKRVWKQSSPKNQETKPDSLTLRIGSKLDTAALKAVVYSKPKIVTISLPEQAGIGLTAVGE